MLACSRIGATQSVVFGGFSAETLRDPINDAEASVVVTADGGYRRGAVVPLRWPFRCAAGCARVVREEDGWGYGGKQLTRKIGHVTAARSAG